MNRSVPAPRVLTAQAKRLILFSFFDAAGVVDESVRLSLEGLRPHAEEILVIVNGAVGAVGRKTLEEYADAVLARPNDGFDIGGHRHALRLLRSRLHEFDEIVMTNDTWYGPVRPWAPVFARMDARACHFWGLTDHAAVTPNPVTLRGSAPYHIQSYWIAVRRDMFLSAQWSRYWDSLGRLRTYVDAVTRHELRFTGWFRARGWVGETAFGCEHYATANPSLFEPLDLILAGCPTLKRRALFHWPPLLSAYASIGPVVLEAATDAGYPREVVLANLSRTVAPRTVNIAAGLHSVVMPAADVGADNDLGKMLVVIGVGAASDVSRLARRIQALTRACGHAVDLLVVVGDDIDADTAPFENLTDIGVRYAVPARVGVDHALLSAAGVVDLADYDLVLRLADEDSADSRFEELMQERRTARAVMELFRDEPRLGLMFASLDHLGGGRIGDGWRQARPLYEQLASWIGVGVPVDDVTPLAPFDGSYLARPAALRRLCEADWQGAPISGFDMETIKDTLGILLATTAGQSGWHTRTVVSAEDVVVSHTMMEYQASAIASLVPGSGYQKIDYLRHSGPIRDDTAGELVKMLLRRKHPRFVARLRRTAAMVRRVLRLH